MLLLLLRFWKCVSFSWLCLTKTLGGVWQMGLEKEYITHQRIAFYPNHTILLISFHPKPSLIFLSVSHSL